jgi:5'-phosphate synthase pdxT subunit
MNSKTTTIGILALQGGVAEHERMLEKAGAKSKCIRTPTDFDGIDGLILPGGESTAIGKLITKNSLRKPLTELITGGLPVWGTCAGAILLAKKGSEYSLKLMDIEVERNSYGSQLASFVVDVTVTGIAEPVRSVFIRAPRIIRMQNDVEVLAEYEEQPVLVRQRNMWAGSFHPELAGDKAIHRAFTEFCITSPKSSK